MSTHDEYDAYEEDQKEFFNKLITNDWSTYNNKHWDFTRNFEAQKILKETQPQLILDVGCGCGYHDFLFAQNDSVKSVLGIDYSKQSIIKANEVYPHPKITRNYLDILENPHNIPEAKFDLTVSFQVIEHVKKYKEFLTYMMNSTKKGGYVVIATPNSDNFVNKVRSLFNKKPLLSDIMHYKEFNIQTLKELGEEIGLEFKKSWGYGFTFNVKFNINRLIPDKMAFYLGRFFPQSSNVITVLFRRK